jgi:alkanesulfonate monooxygenase SsuD/methylene tetrahydromethanopterin reductase-like flavin-dependent oxidoreductase (luciferase family)
MLPVVARHADWYNITPAPLEGLARVLPLLKQACEQEGRDYDTLGKSLEMQILVAETPTEVAALQREISARNPQRYQDWDGLAQQFIIGDVETVTKRIEAYREMGIDYFMFWFMDYPSRAGMQCFAERVMPSFRTAHAQRT